MLIIHRKSIMLMHRPQTPQPGFGSITLLQKFTPHFKILDPRLNAVARAPPNDESHVLGRIYVVQEDFSTMHRKAFNL